MGSLLSSLDTCWPRGEKNEDFVMCGTKISFLHNLQIIMSSSNSGTLFSEVDVLSF